MTLRDQRNNLRTTLFEVVQLIHALQNEDSVDSSLLEFAAFQHAHESFLQYFQTENLCSEDVPLPLERLDESAEYTVVWLHCDKKLNNDIEEDALTKLHSVFSHVEIFDNMEKCIHFLRQLDSSTTRLFLVTTCFYDGRVCLLNLLSEIN